VSRDRCTRMWEATAVEDGRLVGADRRSFERHVETCRVCADEVQALSCLRQTMQAVQPSALTELDLRRMRHGLLRQAHARRARREVPGRRSLLMVLMAIVAIAVVATTLRRAHPPSLLPPPVLVQSEAERSSPFFDFVNVAGAIVTSRTEPARTGAVLSDGIAAFHVEHVRTGHRFLLALPDGEIEVRGTRFTVSVQHAQTQSVEVSEGIVALRLQGQPERLLGAGERWALPVSNEAVAKETSEASPRKALPNALAAARRSQKPAPSTPTGDARSDAPSTDDRRAAEADRAAKSQRFAAAVESFRQMHYASADALLQAFVRDYRLDPRCEDASFLRAVAHSRMGDAAGAADLARAYLANFPHGLRRLEASGLVEPNNR
jgi:hypothetical protein